MKKPHTKYKIFALIVPLVPLIGTEISSLTYKFRFSLEYHWVYSAGVDICFTLWLAGSVWAIINGIYISRQTTLNAIEKTIWIVINYATIIYLIVMITIVMLRPV